MQASYDAVAEEFSAVNELIISQLVSSVPLVEDISQYLVASGGKRVRPLVTLLCAGALGTSNNSKQIQLATVVEFLHTATLLHDDVVDMSTLRRGQPTANANWGNASSVLVGDFVYSRAFQLMVDIGSLQVMKIMSDTTTRIAEGEVQQLSLVGNIELTESDYFDVIRNKTAQLFEGACESAAVIAEASPEFTTQLRNYGKHLGLAFQLVDDYLDYAGDEKDLGKHVGDDFAEGKLTLPTIDALRLTKAAASDDYKVIRTAIVEKDMEQIPEVIRIVKACGALDRTLAIATEQADLAIRALKTLPDSKYKAALQSISEFLLSRTS